MIELSLEQAKILLDVVQADRVHVFAHEFDVICSLMERVKEAEALQAPKPGPRFEVFESSDGKGFVIWDTIKRARYDDYYSCIEREARDYANALNHCEPSVG